MANFFFPVLKGFGGFGRRVRFIAQHGGDLRVLLGAEAKDRLREVLLGGRAAAPPGHLAGVEAAERLERKVPLSHEDRARFEIVDES